RCRSDPSPSALSPCLPTSRASLLISWSTGTTSLWCRACGVTPRARAVPPATVLTCVNGVTGDHRIRTAARRTDRTSGIVPGHLPIRFSLDRRSRGRARRAPLRDRDQVRCRPRQPPRPRPHRGELPSQTPTGHTPTEHTPAGPARALTCPTRFLPTQTIRPHLVHTNSVQRDTK